jgi:hypothetical protein
MRNTRIGRENERPSSPEGLFVLPNAGIKKKNTQDIISYALK